MQEEAAEVIQALSHYMRDRCDRGRVCEELADLEFMLDQLKIYFGTNIVEQHKINNAIKMVARLEKRKHGKDTHFKNNHIGDNVDTKLGGKIFGNKNLTTNAKVILNEVSSTNRSSLAGWTEIAGQKADLIIANPNGITINE